MKTIQDLDALIKKLVALRGTNPGNVPVMIAVDQESGPYSRYVEERELLDIVVAEVDGQKVLQLIV